VTHYTRIREELDSNLTETSACNKQGSVWFDLASTRRFREVRCLNETIITLNSLVTIRLYVARGRPTDSAVM
jgi:hypothetical protein